MGYIVIRVEVLYSKETGYSLSKVQRMMKKLQGENVIWRKGSKKTGSWEVNKIQQKRKLF